MTKLMSPIPILALAVIVLVHGSNARSHHRAEDPVFKLETALEFKGRVVSGTIRKSEIPTLLNLPVRNGDTDPEHKYGVEMTTSDNKKVTAFTCREWLRARKRGEYSATTYDMAMESFLIHTCGLLYVLQGARPPMRSYVTRATLADLNLLPAEMLASIPYNVPDRLRRMTVAQVVPSKNIEKVTAGELRLSYGGFQQWFSEAGRADFNGDGVEDIFVLTGAQAEGGTMGVAGYLVLTRTSSSEPLQLIEPNTDPLKGEREAMP
ncbi:MAG: hypothetical protein ACRD8A_10260 [Candidatus Acidiferrales bacterium]